jgi:tetratricopeptide (TPR) repeat protein
VQRQAARTLGELARTRGQIAEGARWRKQMLAVDQQRNIAAAPLMEAVGRASDAAWYLGEMSRGAAILDSALAGQRLDGLAPADRPYVALADAYAQTGRVDRARAMLAANEQLRGASRDTVTSSGLHLARGDIAIAEHKFDVAIREFRLADVGLCPTCTLPSLARAYDLAGNADSAIAIFRRYTDGRNDVYRPPADPMYLAGSYKRLGELYQARGDNANATTYLTKFVELWKNADAALQPKVADAKARLATIQRGEKR